MLRMYCISPYIIVYRNFHRFHSEKLDGLHAAGEEYLTNKQPSKTLKPGCYDTVDGYLDPKEKGIYKDEFIYVKYKMYDDCYCYLSYDILLGMGIRLTIADRTRIYCGKFIKILGKASRFINYNFCTSEIIASISYVIP